MPRGHARYVLAIMVVINLLNYADRWIAAAVAPLIQAEFRLLDFQVGLLGSAFLVVYAVSALPFGYWADRGVRRTVIGVGVTIWSVATVASGFVQSYTQLFLTRTVLGLGEASYYPAGGTVLGGWLADRFSGRTQRAYLMVGIAGFVLASGTITLALVLPLSVAGVPVFVPLFFVSVVLVYLYSGPFTAISQNVVTPGLRAGAVTMLLFISHLFGDSHAPATVGWLSDQLHSLQLALLLTSAPLLILAAALAATGLGSADADTARMGKEWAEKRSALQPAAP